MIRPVLAASAAAAVVLAGVAGWLRPLPAAPVASVHAQAAWSLPAAASLERSTAAQYAAIQGVGWGGDGTAAGGGGATEWTLLGVSDRGSARAALIRQGTDPLVKPFQSGDILPDGSRLVAVDGNGIVVERDGCRVTHLLYPSTPPANAAAGEDCDTTPDRDTPSP